MKHNTWPFVRMLPMTVRGFCLFQHPPVRGTIFNLKEITYNGDKVRGAGQGGPGEDMPGMEGD